MLPPSQLRQPIREAAADNLRELMRIFADCGDIAIEEWTFGPGQQCRALTVYCRSFVEGYHNHYLKQTVQDLLTHEAGMAESVTPELIASFFGRLGAPTQPFCLLATLDEASEAVLDGHVVLLFDGWNAALAYETPPLNRRQVTEPINEPSVHGPREGTVENLDTNLAMLRQRVKTPQLKMVFLTAGEKMRTRIVYVYLEQTVNPEVLAEFRRRLEGIERHEVLETSYVQEWIQDSLLSPFPQVRNTERTDTAAAALLDGKILVLAENTPMILICPALFVDFIGTAEDYYVRTVFATLVRLLRLVAFTIALMLPSTYIALSTFHPELIPTVLLMAILDSRENIPFPALIEALIMEVSFELLREAGIRLPRPVGAAVSIVGALVIGQAAITAKIASPMMVIIVALTGIASFAIPHYDLAITLRILRFPYMVAAGLLGGFGLMAAVLVTLIHLTSLHSLGVPYLSSLAPLKLRDMRDVFIRAPLKRMMVSPRNRMLHRGRRGERPT